LGQAGHWKQWWLVMMMMMMMMMMMTMTKSDDDKNGDDKNDDDGDNHDIDDGDDEDDDDDGDKFDLDCEKNKDKDNIARIAVLMMPMLYVTGGSLETVVAGASHGRYAGETSGGSGHCKSLCHKVLFCEHWDE
jgi:hypothetical protein